ncbi:MAG: MCE family protein [Verrucomicrobia bacterium]|nr:MCE family protein [Verrucomicrobiota bacterium]
MSDKRLEIKVGLFVLIGLTLIAALLLYFSKGTTLFTPTYNITLKTSKVGGLKSQAQVLISGVPVGRVESIALSEDGKTATVQLKILERYRIYPDAEFAIDSLGFLGDQYISVLPTENKGEPLQSGAVVEAKEPFDMQELARASMGFVTRLDTTAQNLNDAILRVDRMVLNEQTLTNLSLAISNLMTFSETAIQAAEGVNTLFETNSSPINAAMTNLVVFSLQLNQLAEELNQTVVTNRASLGRAMNNLEKSSHTLREILADLNAGTGLAGSLIRDEDLKVEMSSLVTNFNEVAGNLSILSSNINTRGLWSVLWKPRAERRR